MYICPFSLKYHASPTSGFDGGVEDEIAKTPSGPVEPVGPVGPCEPVGPVGPVGPDD
jgi:hypothetical protein